MRGEGCASSMQFRAFGITPACAGRSFFCGCRFRMYQDHPRVRGEKIVPPPACFVTYGSPPRARGEERSANSTLTDSRITPACAGRSLKAVPQLCPDGDHPRVCGEKKIYNLPSWNLGGSPPRVRGEGLRITVQRRPTRITPACAGRSCTARGSGLRRPDHPRVCGEKSGRA